MYDLIWHLELPPFRDDEPLDELVVRGVLMALASYLNHQQLKAHKYRVYPSDELLATQIGRSPKTVARVLDYLLRTTVLVLVRAELRPGRGRAGRPPIYSLPIDVWLHWPKRVIRRSRDDGLDTGVQTITAQTPVANGSATGVPEIDRVDTGVQQTAMDRTPVSTEPGHSGNPAISKNPVSQPGNARARANDTDHDSSIFQVALPGHAASGMPGSSPHASASAAVSAGLGEGQRIWGAARQQLFRTGLDRALERRLRNTGTAGYDSAAGVLTLNGDLVAEDLAPGSLVMNAVAAAAAHQLKVELVGGGATRHVPPSTHKTSNDLGRGKEATVSAGQSDDAPNRRARFEQRLSAEDRALLQELERQRLAHAEQAVVPVAADQVEKAETDQLRTGRADAEIAEQQAVAQAPRRRRRKEPAVA